MNADERRQTLTACAGGRVREHPRSSAVCKAHSCLKSYAATKSVRIRNKAQRFFASIHKTQKEGGIL